MTTAEDATTSGWGAPAATPPQLPAAPPWEGDGGDDLLLRANSSLRRERGGRCCTGEGERGGDRLEGERIGDSEEEEASGRRENYGERRRRPMGRASGLDLILVAAQWWNRGNERGVGEVRVIATASPNFS